MYPGISSSGIFYAQVMSSACCSCRASSDETRISVSVSLSSVLGCRRKFESRWSSGQYARLGLVQSLSRPT